MRMYVDQRVGSADLVEPIRKMGYSVTTGIYTAGDIWFWGVGPEDTSVRVGIERKNIHDLVDSMRGRLMAQQWPGMKARYQRAYLMVEGIVRVRQGGLEAMDKAGKWQTVRGQGGQPASAAAVDAFLVSVREFTSMKVVYSRTPEDTARMCGVLYQWWKKPYEAHSSYDPIYAQTISTMETWAGIPTTKKTPMILKTLVQVHGVAKGRAETIAGDYPTVVDLCKATKPELQAAYGKVIGERIYDSLRGKY